MDFATELVPTSRKCTYHQGFKGKGSKARFEGTNETLATTFRWIVVRGSQRMNVVWVGWLTEGYCGGGGVSLFGAICLPRVVSSAGFEGV